MSHLLKIQSREVKKIAVRLGLVSKGVGYTKPLFSHPGKMSSVTFL
jgi:hypothetical protein